MSKILSNICRRETYRRCLNVFSFAILFLCFNIAASDLQGQLTLVGKNSSKAKVTEVVIYFEPESSPLTTPLKDPHVINMKNKSYRPRVSVVPVNSQIKISNGDSILHNAFSPSKPNDFDLGLYSKSEGKIHTIQKAGVVRVFCNVHYHMVAYVLALNTPFYTRPDIDGNFYLSNLPQGKGKLVVWHERAKRLIKEVVINGDRVIDVDLPITKRRIPKHKNKSGKKYKKKKRRRKYRS